jgi:hypothetical protein
MAKNRKDPETAVKTTAKAIETQGKTAASNPKATADAEREAEKDIRQDPDLNDEDDPGSDLDEGELANLDNSNDEVPI